nr:unnamed protein product [Callosobruchus chinensis]
MASAALTAKAEDSAQKLKRGLSDSNNQPLYTKQYLQKPSSGAQQEYVYVQPQASAGREQQYTIVPQGKVLPATQEYQQQYYQQVAAQYQQPQAHQQAQAQPQYYQAEQTAQPEPKYASVQLPSAQKIAYSSQPQQHTIPYSSAADVSSFSYSSPVVSYNSQGLFQQLAGKAPAGTAQAATYSQPTKVQYISVPRTKSAPVSYSPAKASSQSAAAAYASAPSAYSASPSAYSQPEYSQASSAYASSPGAYSQGSPSAHSGSPTTYSEAVASQPSYAAPAAAGLEDGSAAYQQVSQKAAAYTRPQAQAIVYQSNPAEHRVNYVPSPERYQASQKAAAQPVQYVRTAPQTFENADHSTQQYIYVQPQATRQYYAVPSQKQGITYAQ